MQGKSRLSALAALVAAAAAVAGSAVAQREPRSSAVADVLDRLHGGGRGGRQSYPRRTPSWSHASYRRAALKARNQARHRAACKGAR